MTTTAKLLWQYNARGERSLCARCGQWSEEGERVLIDRRKPAEVRYCDDPACGLAVYKAAESRSFGAWRREQADNP